MLALGDAAGTLHIFQLPWSLSNPSSKEVREGSGEKGVCKCVLAYGLCRPCWHVHGVCWPCWHVHGVCWPCWHVDGVCWWCHTNVSLKVAHLEAFFDREVKKLEFVTERAEMRARAKRDKDSTTQNIVKEEVCFLYI